jgi:sugar phosphate isomerase/epimerase
LNLGVVSNALLQFQFDEGLDVVRRMNLDRIEIACAGYHRNRRFGDPEQLLSGTSELERWLDAFEARGLGITALAIHGPALSPNRAVARGYSDEFRRACELAERIGVSRLTLLGGLPEGAEGDTCPHWVVNAWPPEEQEILKWQWEERVLPFWSEHGRIAESHGCRLCFEMHPNDVVYNPATLLRLREAVGEVIGCNFDPSHLFWYGIDPLVAMRHLGPAIYHVHAKDAQVVDHVADLNGVFDPTPFSDIGDRAWDFRTVGFGHGEPFWRDFVSTLRAIGYDDVLSIEHEDEYMDPLEGFEKAVSFLQPLLLKRPRVSSWALVDS